jgi:type VI secretion system protein ImpE
MAAPLEAAERSVRDGDLEGALKNLQAHVRAEPSNAKLRVFLFQLLALLGRWDRALTHLDVAATLDPAALAMKQVYREAIACEMLRTQVFAGQKAPMVLGQPDEWLALLIESTLQAGRGAKDLAESLRARAFDLAPTSAGAIDGKAFEWIADADMRFGPVLEAIMNGRYYWVPFAHLACVVIEKPADLRDFVWAPAYIELANGGASVALIPARYPGTELADDGALVLGRKTVWSEFAPSVFHGLGQRVIATDVVEVPLLEIREIRLGAAGAA